MLRHLRATNFAILSDVGIEFGPGMNVLSGETGAGKSLIVEAVNLLRGGRASANIPREGAKEAVVEAIFEVPADLAAMVTRMLADAGLPQGEAGDLLVRRIIARGGRSRTYINGALTTASCLGLFGSLLVDLSSQHQHQGLTDPRRHLTLLDAFADAPESTAEMASAYRAVREVRTLLGQLAGGADIDKHVDFLRFQLEELDDADITAGEDLKLEAERRRLASADKLARAAERALDVLYNDDDSAADRIRAAEAQLERVAELDPTLAATLGSLGEARALVDDVAATIRDHSGGFEADPARLEAIDERLALLGRLKRKHNDSLEALLVHREELAAELAALENLDSARAELEASLVEAEAAATARAQTLTAIRRKAARRLGLEVGRALADLGMASASLEIVLDEAPLAERGADAVEMLLRANPGEAAKPLAKVASGGELSRIMLAIKLVLRRAEEVSCYVFDEVDSGIGGEAAEVVGRQIHAVSESRQVLCVTHLAPIAVFADHHFRVEKQAVAGRTETDVTRLDPKERPNEIARMLGGAHITKRARAHAKEMIEAARG